jgi:hypothetical protein
MVKVAMKRFICGCSLLLLLVWALPVFSYEQADCLRCHGQGSSESNLTINQGAYEHSVHYKEITCLDCHTGIENDAHMKQKGSGKVDCHTCHDQENRHGLTAQGPGIRPKCNDCHTKHAILDKANPDSSVSPANFSKTCGPCHPAQFGETGVMTWLPSVQIKTHGKQDFSCDFDEQDCLGCHQGKGAHGEGTLLNDRDCWKCHFPKNGRARVMGNIHPKSKEKNDTRYIIAGAVYGVAAALLLFGGCCFYGRRFSTKSGNKKGR